MFGLCVTSDRLPVFRLERADPIVAAVLLLIALIFFLAIMFLNNALDVLHKKMAV